jgi:hypothetical protein
MLGTPSNVFLSRLLRAKYSEGDEGIIMTLLVGEKKDDKWHNKISNEIQDESPYAD